MENDSEKFIMNMQEIGPSKGKQAERRESG